MQHPDRPRVISIDDHPVVAMGLGHPDQEVELVASFTSVEEFLRSPHPAYDAVLLDLQFDTVRPPGKTPPASGTHAIRLVLDNGQGPVVVYTSIAEEMILAACLAAGATGIVTKKAPPRTIGDVVRAAAEGNTWVDPMVAGALRRWADRRHAGVLSPQQANALRYRGQGLTQKAIAEKIGVSDPESVNRYLRAAVDKLAEMEDAAGQGMHPGALTDDLARRSGLAGDMVRHADLPEPTRRRRSRKP
jgi:DNA-binding NarL/FixJ family response regulator